MNLTLEIASESEFWRNEDLYNELLHSRFTKRVNESEILKSHRDYVEQNQYGFGDRAFGWVWNMLVDAMPADFDFLEIGVFKGQVTSLIALLAHLMEKKANIVGVTTLQNTPDERCKYPEGDYRAWIAGIHDHFHVPQPRLVVGRSNDQHVLAEVGAMDFDLVYIDGSHNYDIVVQDIDNYGKRVRVGGFLIMDDSSNLLNIGNCWPGLPEVSRAVQDYLEPNPAFRHLFACGHLRTFQRIKE